MQQEIDQIKGHYIACRFGRVARQVVENLQLHQMPVVAVEPDDAAYAEGEAEPPRIRGDATEELEILMNSCGRGPTVPVLGPSS